MDLVKLDRRVAQRNIRKKTVTREEYDSYLRKLPDSSQNAHDMTEDVAPILSVPRRAPRPPQPPAQAQEAPKQEDPWASLSEPLPGAPEAAEPPKTAPGKGGGAKGR